MSEKISVIVPVYNTKKYLSRCVDSLLDQTLQELQVILIDDGSTDGSSGLCDSYARMDARVCVIHKENQGLGMARNSGLEIAAGEYVSFVDSDDTIEPDMYERMYVVAKEQEADMVLAGMKQVGGNLFADNNAEKEVCCFAQKEVFSSEEGRKKLLLGIVGALPEEQEDSRYNFSVCKNIYSNQIIQSRNLRFVSERKIVSEDVIFLIEFAKYIHKAVGIPGAFYHYYRNESSVTRTYCKGRFLRFKGLAEEIHGRLLEIMPEEEFQLYLDRLFQARARVAVVDEIQDAKACKISWKILRQNLHEICKDEELQQVLKRYPYTRLPAKQAIFAFTMRYCLAGMQYLLVSLKEGR